MGPQTCVVFCPLLVPKRFIAKASGDVPTVIDENSVFYIPEQYFVSETSLSNF